MRKQSRIVIGIVLIVAMTLSLTAVIAQRSGASATIRVGTVTDRKPVELQDDSAAKGALVGGVIGLATGSGKSSGTKFRRAAAGAAVGGAAGASKPKQTGMMYTVKTGDGTLVKIVSDQTEVQQGDCVAVEETGGRANIRRLAATACEPESAEVMSDPAVVEEMQEEAAECLAAKQELLDADSDEAVDRALRKVEILCND